jgi:YegS/Rv2252/BmrU family lipid kinase
MKRALVVYNPVSRNAPSWLRLHEAARSMAGDGWEVSVSATQAPGHGIELARTAATDGVEVVFSCGGDGTINEVLNGIAGSATALGVLRGGMGDVFGKEAGIPKAPEKGLRVLVDGSRHRIDVGRANERYFLLMAGVGFDAEVVKAVPSRPKRLLGSTSYALWAVAKLPGYRARPVELTVDGEPMSANAYWLLLGNTRSYGGILNIAGAALADDGLLDAYLFEARNPLDVAATAAHLVIGKHESRDNVTFHRVRELIVSTPGLAVQLDGEYCGETPVRFTIEPQALDVLLPRGKADHLFSRPAVT